MRKNRLIALIGTLTMAAAGLAAVSAGVSSKKADSVSAADSPVYGGSTFYVFAESNSDFSDASAKCCVYFFGGNNGSQWSNLVSASNGYYTVTVPGDSSKYYNTAIAVRHDPSDSAAGWSSWGQTKDAPINGNTMYIYDRDGNDNKYWTGNGSTTLVTYYFCDKSGNYHDNRKAHFWNNNNSKVTTAYPGFEMDDFGYRNGLYYYSISTVSYFDRVQFNDNSSKTSTLDCSSQHGKAYTLSSSYGWGAGSWGDLPTTLKFTLNNQGATTSGSETTTATIGSNFNSITVPKKTNFEFDGYYSETNGGGTKYIASNGTSAANCDFEFDDTLYANWVAEAAPTYTVTFNNGGGTGSMTGYTKDVGESFEVPAPTFTAPSKKKFSHWLGSDGASYNPGTVIGSDFTKDTAFTLTAVWKDYDITDGFYLEFNAAGSQHAIREKLTWNGSEGASSNHNIEGLHLDAGDSFKVVKYENEQIKNYFGTDKADNKDGAAIKEGQLYANGSQDYVVRVEGDYDIYFNDQYDWEASNLVWVPANTYTVTYKANEDGSGDDQTQTAYYYYNDGGTGTSFAKNVFASTTFAAKDSKSKTFVGWCASADGQGTILVPGDMQATSDKVPNPASGETSVTLYAIWRDKVPADGFYATGNFSAGDGLVEMTRDEDGNQYYVDVTLAKNEKFKFVQYSNEADINYFGGDLDIAGSDSNPSAVSKGQLTIDGSNDYVATVPGTYRAYLKDNADEQGKKIWVGPITVQTSVTFDVNNESYGSLTGYDEPFNVDSGTAIVENGASITIGDKTITAVPTTDTAQFDYEFTGWTIDPEGTTVEEDTTITANFTQTTQKYTVTWKNGDTELKSLENVAWGSSPEYDGDTPTKESTATTDYTFSGWSPAQGAITGNTVYQAQFSESTRKYTVTFKNDGNGKVYCEDLETEASSITVPYGTTISTNGAELTVGANEYLAIEDDIPGSTVTFNDWTISPAGSTVAGNVTITANFTVVDNEYMLAYQFNGGTPTSEDYSHEGFDYHYGDEIELPTLTKDGYTFVGFCEDEELEGDCYVDTYTLTDDVELYAKFTLDSYNITFSNNGGQGGSIDKTSYSISELDQVVNITAPTKEGNGPSYTITKGTDYVGNDPVVQNSSVIIPHGAYGSFSINTVWTADTYTVSYAAGSDASGEIASQTKTYGIDLTLSSSTFNRTGYHQIGWAKSDGGSKVYDLGGTYSANAGVTLYPVWELNTYTVSYDKGSYGQGEIASQTKSYGINLALRDSVFTRTGYTQVGWATSDGGSKAYDLGGTYSENAGVTLYPVWKANTYVVNYAPGTDATGSVDSQEKVHDVALTLSSSTFTKEGYEQIGWAISDGGEKAYDLGGSYTANEGVTLYPVWRETASHKAQVYAKNFMDNVGGLCEDTENILDENRAAQLAALATEWANQAEAFAALDQDVKDILMSKDITPNPEGTDIEKFISLYDYTMGRYPQGDGAEVTLSNFLSRTQSSAARKVISISDVSTSTWIIAAVAVVGIAAVGVFFIYRKRKEI